MIFPLDEILAEEATYSITRSDGSPITSFSDLANCKISLVTEVVQEGTPLNKHVLLNMLDFSPKTTEIDNNTITETDGVVTKTTTFIDGNVTETLTNGGNKRYVKSSTWVDGQLVEEVTEETINE